MSKHIDLFWDDDEVELAYLRWHHVENWQVRVSQMFVAENGVAYQAFADGCAVDPQDALDIAILNIPAAMDAKTKAVEAQLARAAKQKKAPLPLSEVLDLDLSSLTFPDA